MSLRVLWATWSWATAPSRRLRRRQATLSRCSSPCWPRCRCSQALQAPQALRVQAQMPYQERQDGGSAVAFVR